VDFLNRNSPQMRRLQQLVEKYHIGGVVLFGGHPSDVHYVINKLQEKAKYPLFIAADLERGVGGIFSKGTSFPHALAWGASDDPILVGTAAQMIAREARALGINLIFAPVLDLANEPNNPIINIRSFHALSQKVIEFSNQFIQAIQGEGLACVGKHFPGHGRAITDSHLELPVIPYDFSELQESDLQPFAEAISTGIKGLMTAHICLPDNPLPATFRNDLITGHLRQKWQFKGLIFSDALNMKAVSESYSPTDQAQLGVTAGLDIFLIPENLPHFFNILKDMAASHPDLRQQMEQSVERIFQLKKWLHARNPHPTHHGRIYKFIEHPNHVGLARRLAKKSITCVHQSSRFPIDLINKTHCFHLIYTDFATTDPPLKTFQEQISDFFEEVKTLINPAVEKIDASEPTPSSMVIISLYSRTFGGHRSCFDWDKINDTVQFISKKNLPLVIVLFGNPFHLQNLKGWKKSDAIFLTYSYVEASQIAAFKAVISAIPVDGKLPVRIQDPAGENFTSFSVQQKPYQFLILDKSSANWQPIEQLVHRAIDWKIQI